MTGDLISFAFTAFATLFVTMGPIETAPIYAALTSGVHKPERRRLAWRSVLIAGVLLFVFGIGGNPMLAIMNVSLPAFRFAGGVMLFLQAITLLFTRPSGMSTITAREEDEALQPGDIAVFPLAFPLIADPGSLAAIILLSGRAAFDPARLAIVFTALLACLLLTYLALRGAERLIHFLGVTGADVIGRVSAILLAALAAQFIFDGLRDAHLFAVTGGSAAQSAF